MIKRHVTSPQSYKWERFRRSIGLTLEQATFLSMLPIHELACLVSDLYYGHIDGFVPVNKAIYGQCIGLGLTSADKVAQVLLYSIRRSKV